MTLQKRGVTAGVSISAGGTIAVPVNGSILIGELMIAWFSVTASDPEIRGEMDGWHEWLQARVTDSRHLIVFYRISNGSEPSTYTTNFGATVNGAMFVVYSDASSHIAIDNLSTDIRAASTSIVFPSVTFSSVGMLLNIATLDSSFSSTPPGGSTEEVDGPASINGRLYLLRENVSSGATGTRTATSTSQSSELLSIALIDATFIYPISPVFRERSITAQQNSVTTYNISAPTNLKVGDTMILHVGFQTTSPTFTVSNGGGNNWNQITNGEITGSNSIHTFYKVAVAADLATTYTISWSGSKTSIAYINSYYSPRGSTLLVSSAVNQTNSATANLPLPTITTAHDNALVISCVSNDNNTTSVWDTTATRGIRHADIGTNIKLHNYSEFVPSLGALGTRTPTIGGASNNSKVVVFELSEVLIPGDPTTLTATKNGSTQIDLAWVDASNNETGFEVERSADGSTGWSLINTTAANATSYSNTGLVENATWYYRVRAVNASGSSAYTNIANVTTDITAPSSLSATMFSDTRIDLAWTDNSSVESGYKIEQSPNGSSSWVVINTTSPNANTYSVTGLTQNTTYYFRVRAFVSAVFSTYTSTANTTTGVASPTSLSALPKLSTKITISWTDNASGEDGFKIERSANGVSGWSQIDTVAANVVTYDNVSLTPNTLYYYRIRAYKGATNSSYTNVASATTYHTLSTPLNLTLNLLSGNSVRLSWQDLDLGVTGYSIERDSVQIATTATTLYIDSTVLPNSVYVYRIRAYRTGSTEYSSYSDVHTITIPIVPREVNETLCFILQPNTIFASVVSMASVQYPVANVSYDTGVVTGDYLDIREGMTICFGSSAGLYDLGRSRIRKPAIEGVIYIGRSARGNHDGEVNLSSGVFITVLDDYRVWSKIPYINSNGVTFKDHDIAFTDQTKFNPPISNCGPGFVDTINIATNKITVGFLSGSQVVAESATLSSYLWDIADGVAVAGSVYTNTVRVEFPAGFRWIHLTVTDSNGKSHTSHAPILAIDPDDDISIRNYQIESHSIKQTGQDLELLIREDISSFVDGTLVILWSGEPSDPYLRDNVKFIGWHVNDPTSIEASKTGTVFDTHLHCTDVYGRLGMLVGVSQIIEQDSTPDNWEEMKHPNLDKYIHYVLYWQSTALELADFTLPDTGTNYQFVVLGSDGMSLADQARQRCEAYVPDRVFTCNRLGQLSIQVDPFFQELADRTSTVQAHLYPLDYTDLKYTVQHTPHLNKLAGSAIVAGLDDENITAIFCNAPGGTIGQGVEEQEHSEQLAINQTDLNNVTGHRYARMNSLYSMFNISLATSDDLDIDPANLTWTNLNLESGITAQRGLLFDSIRGLVKELTIRYNYSRTGTTRTIDLIWEKETFGYPALTETKTIVSPVDDGGWTPDPVIPIEPPVGLPSGLENVVMIDNHMGIMTTSDFQSTTPTWSIFDDLFTDTSVDNFSTHPLFSCIVDPFSPLYRGSGTTVRAFAVNVTGVWKIDDLFGVDGDPTKTLLYTFANTSFVQHRTIMASFGRYFDTESDNPWLVVASTYNKQHLGSVDTVTSANGGSIPAGGTYGYNGVTSVFSKDAGQTWSEEYIVTTNVDTNVSSHGVTMRTGLYCSPKTPGLVYLCAFDPEGNPATGIGHYSTNWGESWNGLLSPNIESGNNLAGTIHIPYPSNDNETIAYYGKLDRSGGTYEYTTWKSIGASTSDITPTSDDMLNYGPFRFPFGIRTYDLDQTYVVMAGRANDVDNSHESTQTHGYAAVFSSADSGATWTRIVDPVSANNNDVYPDQAMFSSDDPDTIYIWGNEYYVAQSVSGVVEDKYGNIGILVYGGYEEVVLFAGGDSI